MKSFNFSLLDFLRKFTLFFHRKMGTFVSDINPVTGKSSWVLKDENYDYHQEIARSAYADMLHDTERNKKYYVGLERAIQEKRKAGEKVNVLDIGTGTGLLSMMAAKLGADTVTACEAFSPMADCARKIIRQNGFADKIKLVPKRSTEVKVGADGDLPQRANILVTEVFDTELIGEGAFGTYTDAHERLLEKDCIVVPTSSNMYVQVVSSELIQRWKALQPVQMTGSSVIKPPSGMSTCSGAISLHDLQLQQLPRDQFTCLSEPIKVFHFDFSGKIPLIRDQRSECTFKSLSSGQTDGILMWWDIKMDTEGEINLSCAPDWGHPNPEELQWRDHWMQAVYYPSNSIQVIKGQDVNVHSNHSEYNLWFDVTGSTGDAVAESPDCTCGVHTAISRTRIGMMNDPVRCAIFTDLLKQNVNHDTVCMCISDGSILPLMAAQLGAKQVFVVETNPLCKRITESLICENNLQNKIVIIEKHPEELKESDLQGEKVNLIVGEPYFQTSILPWHNIQFWNSVNCLSKFSTPKIKVLPCKMVVKAVAVDFDDLWKIRAPVGNCEGFDLGIFDKLIEESSDAADEIIEPQPLWEYPCVARSNVEEVFKFSYPDDMETASCSQEINLRMIGCGRCNGVALWADFHFGEGRVISTGPRETTVIGQKIEWDFYCRQGVHLLKEPINIDNKKQTCAIKIKSDFKPFESEDIVFSFVESFTECEL